MHNVCTFFTFMWMISTITLILLKEFINLVLVTLLIKRMLNEIEQQASVDKILRTICGVLGTISNNETL